MNRRRKIIIILSVVVMVLILVVPFGVAAMIYEGNFGNRYETYTPYARSVNEFEGLNSQKYTFTSNDGQTLVGYKYYRDIENIKGFVIISHGLGGGGHNSYLDVANFFTTKGYAVFAYDATGNDESQGDSVKGIPQFLIDLDYAIKFVKQSPDFDNAPIVLFGHSLGGYSAGSVLNLQADIKALVMVAGFDKSIDIIQEEGRKIAGDGINVLLPYISLYEKIKFGDYSSYNCNKGFDNTDTGVMIIHSSDDEMISHEKSFDIFYDRYKDNPRFDFIEYENRGHDYVYYSDKSRQYKEEFNREFDDYIKSLDEEFTAELKAEYLNENLDKKQLYDLDEKLMDRIVEFYDKYVQGYN